MGGRALAGWNVTLSSLDGLLIIGARPEGDALPDVYRSSMRSALLAALAVVSLAACDTDGIDPRPPGPARVDTLGTFAIPARATYLRTDAEPDALDAQPLDLDVLGVEAGDTLSFYVTGYAILDPRDPTGTRTRDLIAVFSATHALAPGDSLQRVTGAIEAGVDLVTPATAVNGLPTDVPEDFLATRSSVVVPAGARHLFLSVVDVFYSDNQNLGEGLQLTLLRR